MNGRTSNSASSICESQFNEENVNNRTQTYLEVLRNVEYPCDIERAFFVKVPERVREVRRLDLPDPHEDQLVVRMPSEK